MHTSNDVQDTFTEKPPDEATPLEGLVRGTILSVSVFQLYMSPAKSGRSQADGEMWLGYARPCEHGSDSDGGGKFTLDVLLE